MLLFNSVYESHGEYVFAYIKILCTSGDFTGILESVVDLPFSTQNVLSKSYERLTSW